MPLIPILSLLISLLLRPKRAIETASESSPKRTRHAAEACMERSELPNILPGAPLSEYEIWLRRQLMGKANG